MKMGVVFDPSNHDFPQLIRNSRAPSLIYLPRYRFFTLGARCRQSLSLFSLYVAGIQSLSFFLPFFFLSIFLTQPFFFHPFFLFLLVPECRQFSRRTGHSRFIFLPTLFRCRRSADSHCPELRAARFLSPCFCIDSIDYFFFRCFLSTCPFFSQAKKWRLVSFDHRDIALLRA